MTGPALQVKLATVTSGAQKGAGLSPGCSTSHPAPCLWPGKAVEDGSWDPVTSMEDPEETPGSWLLALH